MGPFRATNDRGIWNHYCTTHAFSLSPRPESDIPDLHTMSRRWTAHVRFRSHINADMITSQSENHVLGSRCQKRQGDINCTNQTEVVFGRHSGHIDIHPRNSVASEICDTLTSDNFYIRKSIIRFEKHRRKSYCGIVVARLRGRKIMHVAFHTASYQGCQPQHRIRSKSLRKNPNYT